MVDNCAPYDITIDRNNLMGLIEVEEDKLILLMEDVISSVCVDIQAKLPKIKRNWLSREDIAHRCHLQNVAEFQEKNIDILPCHQCW